MNEESARAWHAAAHQTPGLLGDAAAKDVCAALNLLLDDIFALYLKTKNVHWRMPRPHFLDYHFLLDAQAEQICATTAAIVERVRQVRAAVPGAHIWKAPQPWDDDARRGTPLDMLAGLRDDNQRVAEHMRKALGVCKGHGDVASARLLESWIDQAERRVWFLLDPRERGDAPERKAHTKGIEP